MTEVEVVAVEVPEVMIVDPCLGPLRLQLTADPCSELWEVAVVSLALSSAPMMLLCQGMKILTFDTNVSMNNIIYSTQIHSHETLNNQHDKRSSTIFGWDSRIYWRIIFPSVEEDGGAVAAGFGVGTDK